jgi:MFS family permease
MFFVNGFVFASWVPHIPAVKAKHALNEAELGIVLLAMALGSVFMLPVAGWLVARLGSRALTTAAVIGFCCALPLPLLSANAVLLFLALALFGALNAALDVAMNAQAVEVEKHYRRAIMSWFHGLFSLGGLVGASAAGISMSAGMQDLTHVVVVASVCVLVVAIASTRLLPADAAQAASLGPVFVRPSGVLLGLGALAFLGLMSEGSVADWSAVYLRDALGASPAFAAAGFAAFSLTMAAGRFAGDRFVNRFSADSVLRASGAIAAVGMLAALIIGEPFAAIVGFALVGIGVSNIIPILFSAAGRVQGVQPGMALAAVATTGYFGFLAGPPLIGFAAQWTSLAIALGMIVVACALVALNAGVLAPKARVKAA